jgi:hypothetical protein
MYVHRNLPQKIAGRKDIKRRNPPDAGKVQDHIPVSKGNRGNKKKLPQKSYNF